MLRGKWGRDVLPLDLPLADFPLYSQSRDLVLCWMLSSWTMSSWGTSQSLQLIAVEVDYSASIDNLLQAMHAGRHEWSLWHTDLVCQSTVQALLWWMVCSAPVSQDCWQLPGNVAGQNKWSRPGVSMHSPFHISYAALTVWMWKMSDYSVLVDCVFTPSADSITNGLL